MADDPHFHAKEPMAPSAGQLAMLAAIDLAEGGQRFNLTECLHLSGDVDVEKCRSALDLLVDRHEMLRAAFLRKGDGWQRSVASRTASDFTLFDLCDLAPAEQKKRLEQIKADFFAMPFDLSRPPLARFLLARFAEREHVLLTSIHHLIADGWSIAVLLRHFAEDDTWHVDWTRDLPDGSSLTRQSAQRQEAASILLRLTYEINDKRHGVDSWHSEMRLYRYDPGWFGPATPDGMTLESVWGDYDGSPFSDLSPRLLALYRKSNTLS